MPKCDRLLKVFYKTFLEVLKKTKYINHLVYIIKKNIGYIIKYIQMISGKKNKTNFLLKPQ